MKKRCTRHFGVDPNGWCKVCDVDKTDTLRYNQALNKRIGALKAECKRQKLSLYASHTDEQNMVVYLIKEIPTFRAKFAQARLV